MQQLARQQFRSFGIRVPLDGTPPSQEEMSVFAPEELNTVPDPTPPGIVFAATPLMYHTHAQKDLNQKLGGFIDQMCSAICSAWSQWQSQCAMTGGIVAAITCSGGAFVGPPWLPFILAGAPKNTEALLKTSHAVAEAISNGWLLYQNSLKVPGLPFYPAFGAFPGPMAPPTPNVPVPVMALGQDPTAVSKLKLKHLMHANYGNPTADFMDPLFDSIADAFEKCFLTWQTSTMVTNVLGSGPIPTFAPPVVPAGPVVGGVANMAPGGLT
jgi:hypothetical protein